MFCFNKNSGLHISFIPSSLLWPKVPWKFLFHLRKFWWPFLVIGHKSSYFPYFFPTFHDRTLHFSHNFSISSLKNSFLVVNSKYGYFSHFITPSPFIHHCKNSLSSLHIFVHHCTFPFITAHFVHHCTLKHALIIALYNIT